MLTSWCMTWGGHLGNDIHEGGPVHAKDMDPLLVVPGAQDDPLPPVAAGGAGPIATLNGLAVVPEHPGDHGILGGFINHVKGGSPIQDA